MAIITLTTDFGLKDHFVSVVKGAIYTELPEARVVDVSHQISPFNIAETAYIITNAYPGFPRGTIHMVGVDAEENPQKKHIVAQIDGHYFICADNGVLSLIGQEIKPQKIIVLAFDRYNIKSVFPTRDVFVRAACHLSRGGMMNVLGKPLKEYVKLGGLQPALKENGIVANVIYIDNMGNVVLNVRKKTFDPIAKGRSCEIILPYGYRITTIFNRYSDIENEDYGNPSYHGSAIAIFNSAQFLEIALYKSNKETVGGADTLLGLGYRDAVIINFIG